MLTVVRIIAVSLGLLSPIGALARQSAAAPRGVVEPPRASSVIRLAMQESPPSAHAPPSQSPAGSEGALGVGRSGAPYDLPAGRGGNDGRNVAQPISHRGGQGAGKPLPPRGALGRLEFSDPAETKANPAANSPAGSLVAMFSSLAMVLGLFFLVMWIARRSMPRGFTALPSDVWEVLGHGSLPGKQTTHLVRCGGKLLLISVTAAGCETLTEIDDPDEVTRLIAACREAHPQSARSSFRQVLAQLGRDPGDREQDNADSLLSGALPPRAKVAKVAAAKSAGGPHA